MTDCQDRIGYILPDLHMWASSKKTLGEAKPNLHEIFKGYTENHKLHQGLTGRKLLGKINPTFTEPPKKHTERQNLHQGTKLNT